MRILKQGKWVATPFKGPLELGPHKIEWDGVKRTGRLLDGEYEAVVEATDAFATTTVTMPFSADTHAPKVKILQRSPLRLWLSEPATVTMRFGTRQHGVHGSACGPARRSRGGASWSPRTLRREGVGEHRLSRGRAARPRRRPAAPIATAIGAPCVLASERAAQPGDEQCSANPSWLYTRRVQPPALRSRPIDQDLRPDRPLVYERLSDPILVKTSEGRRRAGARRRSASGTPRGWSGWRMHLLRDPEDARDAVAGGARQALP